MKGPLVLLLALLAMQCAIVLAHHDRPLITDELYFFAKARYLAEHGTLAPIGAQENDIVRGTVWGTSDWRPPAYAILVAAIGFGAFDDPAAVRLRVTIAQLALMAGLLVALFLVFARSTASGRAHWIAAFLFGIQPWTFDYASDVGPDSINAFLAGAALLLLWRRSYFFGTLVASATLHFRPEMIVMAPVMAGAALLLRRREGLWRNALAAACAFALVVGLQVAYRTAMTGQVGIFGAYRIINQGAFNWTRTWLGTEKEAYDFVYAITEGRLEEVPARAFDSERERALVERLMLQAQARGYSQEIDEAFQKLADERKRAHPLRMLFIRALNVPQLWLHLETPSPILEMLAPVPRPIRRPILGALLLLRVAILIAALAAFIRACKRWRRGEADAFDALTLLMFAFVVARTLLAGLVFDWRVHRYMLPAWVPLLWCAAAAFSSTATEYRTASSGRGAFGGERRAGDGGEASAAEARPC